jgi:hypothetical protein
VSPDAPQYKRDTPTASSLGARGHQITHALEGLLLIAGLILFGLLLYNFGVATVLANVRLVGWGMIVLVLQEILIYTANTAGWYTAPLYRFPLCWPPVSLVMR